MKKIAIFIAILGIAGVTNAQNINDVVDYGTTMLNGTARYQSMSGAFGALGGDLSALNTNPAGSAVFNNGIITVSGISFNNKAKSTYFGTQHSRSENDIQLNQLGGVMVFNNTRANTNWNKIALAFNYEFLGNGDTELFANGRSDQSVDDFFVNNANGYVLDEVSALPNESFSDAYYNIGSDPNLGYNALQGLLGYEGFLINSIDENDSSNTIYEPNSTYSNINQEYFQSTRNTDSKFTANFATMFNDNLYLGANLNFYNINREKLTWIYEDGFESSSNVQRIYFEDFLKTYGNAFSFNLGAIAKVSDMVRLGATYDSPTWYNLTDELQQYLESDADTGGSIETIILDPRIVFVFPEYKIQLPSKYTGSVALIFGQQGLISFDYSYQDMSKAKLKPSSDPFFSSENNYIQNNLKAVSTYRIGGEYRIERLSLRAGYRFEESPYEDGNTVGDLSGYSLGLGYAFGATKIDLGFSQLQRDYNQQLYSTGLTNTTSLDKEFTNVALSVSFNL